MGWLGVFRSRRMAALALLGASGGLPLFLTSKTLQAWMTARGVDLSTIGLLSLVGLPYSTKFLWAPLLDRYRPPFLGRRRGWLVLSQAGLSLAVAALAFGDPRAAALAFGLAALAVSFLSATQDILIDAYRVDLLEPRERGAGIASYVAGYRAALIVTGSLALVLADRMSWRSVYLLMAGLLLLAPLASAWAPEPPDAGPPPPTLREAVADPFRDFFSRGAAKAGAALAFILLYRLADSYAGSMSIPFLLRSGFTQTEVGAIQGGLGLAASIAGAFAGGAVLGKLGLVRGLWLFGFLQMASNLGYVWLSLDPRRAVLVPALLIENLCAGLVVAVYDAFIVGRCSPRHSATQYALMTSLMAFSRDILVAPAGRLAEAAGWPAFFLLTIAAGIPGLLLLAYLAPELSSWPERAARAGRR